MSEVTISHHEREDGGEYVAATDDAPQRGRLEWESRGDNVRVATHTLVPPPIAGRGIAARLVEAMVADAREQGFKIDPQCSYVAAKFGDNPDWSDLRA